MALAIFDVLSKFHSGVLLQRMTWVSNAFGPTVALADEMLLVAILCKCTVKVSTDTRSINYHTRCAITPSRRDSARLTTGEDFQLRYSANP